MSRGPEASPRKTVRLIRITDGNPTGVEDVAAVEEPLEIRLHDRSFAVIMRTPGADRALAAGFLLAEGVIASGDQLGAVEHCRHPDHPEGHNVVNVFLLGEAAVAWPGKMAERRNVVTNSSCGICGRVTIESLRTRASPLPHTALIDHAVVHGLPGQLRARQPLFDETGGVHGAAIFTFGGDCVAVAEDVGRHNAVDKVVGERLLDGRLPLDGHAMVVSGRVSFEIVQKAWLAGIEVICAVSAPSSLAVELAEQAGITLVGFARPPGFNLYSHPGRLRM